MEYIGNTFQTSIDGKVMVYEMKFPTNAKHGREQLELYANMLRRNGLEVKVETEWGAELKKLQSQFFCAISKGEKPASSTTFWTRVKGWFRK